MVSSRILQACAGELSHSLALVFSIYMQRGSLPENWKMANVLYLYLRRERNNISPTIDQYHCYQ
jgi:hypothetical protein